jgi:hypothetical protein
MHRRIKKLKKPYYLDDAKTDKNRNRPIQPHEYGEMTLTQSTKGLNGEATWLPQS